jgi:hypothetical protein|tara:strand:+ start:426 stop:653 length:228 start_codon:yes stop_codon:yes gene_type:complete
MNGFKSQGVSLSKPHETATDRSTKVANQVLSKSGLAGLAKQSLKSKMYKRVCAAQKNNELETSENQSLVFINRKT